MIGTPPPGGVLGRWLTCVAGRADLLAADAVVALGAGPVTAGSGKADLTDAPTWCQIY